MAVARGPLAALLAAALVAAACSGDDDAPEATAGTGPGVSSTSTTVVASSAPPPPATAAPGSPASPGGPGAPDPGSGATAPPATVAPKGSPAPDPGAVGSYAPFYLRPAESARIVLEIRSQQGAEPRGDAIGRLQQLLADVSGKEVVTSGGDVDGSGRQWTPADLRALADTSSVGQSRDGAVLRILFLHGGYADSDTALGVAVRSDVAAIFSDRVDEAAGLFGGGARIEEAVTRHEAGHLLGLVDLHLATGRQDPEHPGHSPNRGSVMYYAVESTLVGSILDGGPPTEFDDRDLADLAAIRAG